MQSKINRVEKGLEDLKQGKMILLIDDFDRENEGDLVIAAEHITPEIMNFFIRNGTGIVCISLPESTLKELELPLMLHANQNSSAHCTPFTIPVDAKEGITTGVSASDRTKTALLFVKDKLNSNDFVKPGHLYPLQAREGGVFTRRGHTEGSLDLMKLSGLKPSAIICEIMNPDGTMAKGQELTNFAQKNDISILSIEDIFLYRLQNESLFEDEVSTQIPISDYGNFKFTVLKEKLTGAEHIVLTKTMPSLNHSPLVRIHSSCITGDIFTSQKCDCHSQLHYSIERISKEGGMLIYLNQEGRGIGLFNKIKAYALQEKGYDTVEANTQLDLPVDCREYYIAVNILRKFNFNRIRLLTNNPKKIDDLKKYGIESIEREPIPNFINDKNHFYLKTKQTKMNHMIHFEEQNFSLESILS